MDKDDIIKFLEARMDKLKRDEPYAVNQINSYEVVIQDLYND